LTAIKQKANLDLMLDELQRKLQSLHKEEEEQQAQRLAQKLNLPYLNLKTLPLCWKKKPEKTAWQLLPASAKN